MELFLVYIVRGGGRGKVIGVVRVNMNSAKVYRTCNSWVARTGQQIMSPPSPPFLSPTMT